MNMMASSELFIVDVGHGNCAIIRCGTEAIVIDAPSRPVVFRALDELGILSIKALVISHADSDHLSGAIPLILSNVRPVEQVYVNRDGRKGEAWNDFRRAVASARQTLESPPLVQPSLSTSDSGKIGLHKTMLHIAHPQPETCLMGTGGHDLDGKKITANNMSAVVRVEYDGDPVCVLAADVDKYSLGVMVKQGIELSAPILVFPHHGGSGGRENKVFAQDFVKAVKPKVVIFSLGRGVHGTPRPEIMAGVREALNGAQHYIGCTQLSKRCALNPVARPDKANLPSDGDTKGSSCLGTVSVQLDGGGVDELLRRLPGTHGKFVTSSVPKALCRKALSLNHG